MGCDENGKVRDDVDDSGSDVVLYHVDRAFGVVHIFRWALEGLDKGPNKVEHGVANDQPDQDPEESIPCARGHESAQPVKQDGDLEKRYVESEGDTSKFEVLGPY